MLSWLEALWLGAAQGIAEFLPISSSTHLGFLCEWLQIDPEGIDLLLHVGTIVSVLFCMRKEILLLLQGAALEPGGGDSRPLLDRPLSDWRAVLAGAIPSMVIAFSLASHKPTLSANKPLVAVFFLCTAAMLLVTRVFDSNKDIALTPRIAIAIGCVQGLAICPGVSRSASTIFCGLALGLAPRQAFRWSFLFSIPAVIGAVAYKTLKHGLPWSWQAVFGCAVAAVLGVFAFKFFRWVVETQRLWWFGGYVLLLAAWLFSTSI